MWACTGGVWQSRTGCGHAQVEFGSLELGVGMRRWIRQSRTGCGHGQVEFGRIELGVGMQIVPQLNPVSLHIIKLYHVPTEQLSMPHRE